ncbi:MAG: hypothetical protein U1E24_02480, partial [Phenylobacterium sp.]|nr:hypothetical protein [Phenylobacterium sp.]
MVQHRKGGAQPAGSRYRPAAAPNANVILGHCLAYACAMVGAVLVFSATDLGGLFGIAVALMAAKFSRSIMVFFLSLANVSLFLAFDNFI